MNENCNTSTTTPSHISATSTKSIGIKINSPLVNNITITANGGGGNQSALELKQGQIVIDPQPLKLSVETSTDWPTVIATFLVGIGSILITIHGWMAILFKSTHADSFEHSEFS